MVNPPRIGLTKVLMSTCNPPSTRQDNASVGSDPPDTMTSMKAPISQGSPILGSTLASGVTAALRADLVHYGEGTTAHVAIVVGKPGGVPHVVGWGSEGGPRYSVYNYRTDVKQFRRYI